MNNNNVPPTPGPMAHPMNAMWPGSNFQRPVNMYNHYSTFNMMQYRMPYPHMNQGFRPNSQPLLQTPYPGIYPSQLMPNVPMPPAEPPKPSTADVQIPTDIPLPDGPPPEKTAPLPNTPVAQPNNNNTDMFPHTPNSMGMRFPSTPVGRFPNAGQQTSSFTPFALQSNKKKRKNKKKNNSNQNNAGLWQNTPPTPNVANIPRPAVPQPPAEQKPNTSAEGGTSSNTNPTTKWPDSLNDYVNRAYMECETDMDKDLMGLMLKGKITAAINSNELYTRDWSIEPIPMCKNKLSQKEEATATPVTFKVRMADRLGTVLRNYRGSRLKSRSSSRDRSRSRSRSTRSRSRSSSRSNRRRRSRSRSRSVDDRRYYSFKKSISSPKKKRKKKPAPGVLTGNVDVSYERLQQRAARFTSGGGRSKSPITVHSRLQYDIDTEGDMLPEVTDCHVVGTSSELEKPFLRLTSAPDASQVRPLDVLRQSLTHVLRKWNLTSDYHYTCEQLKSIRQDLTVQGIRDEFTIEVYETHARICLEKKDTEEFNQCQTQLKMLYSELGGQNRMEFTAYRIMYYLYTKNTQDLTSIIGQISTDDKQNDFIKHALKVAHAWYTSNYHQFFQLYLEASETTAHMMSWFIDRERKSALRIMIKAYRQTLPVVLVAERLAFLSLDQFFEFATPFSLTYSGEANCLIDCKSSMAALGSI